MKEMLMNTIEPKSNAGPLHRGMPLKKKEQHLHVAHRHEPEHRPHRASDAIDEAVEGGDGDARNVAHDHVRGNVGIAQAHDEHDALEQQQVEHPPRPEEHGEGQRDAHGLHQTEGRGVLHVALVGVDGNLRDGVPPPLVVVVSGEVRGLAPLHDEHGIEVHVQNEGRKGVSENHPHQGAAENEKRNQNGEGLGNLPLRLFVWQQQEVPQEPLRVSLSVEP
mmetsp:Transcript_21889/g.55158  ORF Transcript_21889/g.55158 Transcript_21889/m.55158 type:complete len:220 (-) Transcript_21889:6096-6755(-)